MELKKARALFSEIGRRARSSPPARVCEKGREKLSPVAHSPDIHTQLSILFPQGEKRKPRDETRGALVA